MAFKFGNALSAVQGESGFNTYSCFRRIEAQMSKTEGTLSTVITNNEINQTFITNLGIGIAADPTVEVTLTTQVGILSTLMRSDAAPRLSQAISPTMTGTWNYTPSANAVPITVNAPSTLTSADMQIWSPLTNEDTVVTNDGDVGIGEDVPTANLSIKSRALTILSLTPMAWYRAQDYDGTTTLLDNSGNGRHLTAHAYDSDLNTDTSAVRPRKNLAGTSRAITNLPSVDGNQTLNTPSAGKETEGLFKVETIAFPAMSSTLGFTVFIIHRDFQTTAVSESFCILGKTADDDATLVLHMPGSNAVEPRMFEGGTPKNFCAAQSHTDGNSTQYWGLRCAATTGSLRATLNGTLLADPVKTFLTSRTFNFVGQISSYGGWADTSFCELIIFNYEMTDGQMTTVNTYLAAQIAASASQNLTDWKDAVGVIDSVVDTNINFGLGTTSNTPAAKLHVIKTTEQMRLGYNTVDYFSTTVANGTGVTFDSVATTTPQFTFLDPVNFSATFSLPYTTSATVGPIRVNSLPWIHNFVNPTGFVAASTDSLANARGIFLGFGAGNFTMSGTSTQGKANIGIGHFSSPALTTGSQNVAIGWESLLANTTGNYNVAIGSGALLSNLTGSQNMALGQAALILTDASDNVGIGTDAGDTNTTGAQNVFIGSSSDSLVGTETNSIAIGYGAVVDASNEVTFGNDSTTLTLLRGDVTLKKSGPTGSAVTIRNYNPLSTITIPSIVYFYDPTAANPTQVRFGYSSTQFFTLSVASAGRVNFAAQGTASSPLFVFDSQFVITNDSTDNFAVRRTAGGGANGFTWGVTSIGTTISITTDGTLSTGLKIIPTAAWAASSILLDVQDYLGSSKMKIDAVNGAVGFQLGVASIAGTGGVEFGTAGTAYTTAFVFGAKFGGKWADGANGTFATYTNAVVGGYFSPADALGGAATLATLIGAFFTNQGVATNRNHTNIIGAMFKPIDGFSGSTASAHGNIYGWIVKTNTGAMNTTATNYYGGYIENPAATPLSTNLYGLAIDQQTQGVTINNSIFLANATTGYKALAIRDQNAWVGSDAAAELTVGGTNCRIITTNIGFYGVAAVARPAAYTQTYATATRTHANPTAVTVATTASTNVAPFGYTTAAQADAIVTAINALVADMANIKQVVNSVIDDGQAEGLLQ